jgi:aminopeptidase
MNALKLRQAAETTVHQVFAVKSSEEVLIVTNPVPKIDVIAQEIYDVARGTGAHVNLMYQETKTGNDFMDQAVLEAIKREPDVVIGIREDSFGKDPEGVRKPYRLGKKQYSSLILYLAEAGKIRSAWCSSLGADDFSRLLLVDYEKMRKLSDKIEKRLNKAVAALVRTNGSTVEIKINHRRGMPDKGDYRRASLYGNIPSGEVCISPELGKVNGEVVLDGVIHLDSGMLNITDPVKLVITNNFISDIRGGKCARRIERDIENCIKMVEKLSRQGEIPKRDVPKLTKNARAIGELGIGFNEKARDKAPTLMEAEKAYGTTHIAIGMNYDGDQNALNHYDGVMRRPELTLVYQNGTEELILKDKTFQI